MQCFMLVIASDIDIVSGSLDLQQVGTHIQTLVSTCPLTTLKLFAVQLLFVGQMNAIGMRTQRCSMGCVLPCLSSFNNRHQHLIKTVLLLIDEFMSGWRPMTTKLGGLPNYTFEPRKPIPLGTMF